MSYCRWSSDDWQCDVYVWADVAGGWRTEVAGRRYTWDVPLPPKVDNLPIGEDHSPERSRWTETDLPEPEGGTSYWHDTPGECADNLERLRGLGFNVPQGAIDSLREEATEDA